MTSRLSPAARRILVRISYLLPAVFGLLLLIQAAVPHIYFVHEAEAHETLSTFSLVSNTLSYCREILSGATEASNYAVVFSYAMLAFGSLFWVALVCYWIMALSTAIASTVAFAYPPTAREANRAKRWFRLFCPNRPLYVISHLLILLSAAFPHILIYFYQNQLGYRGMTLHFFGPADLILAVIFVTVSLGAHFALLQTELRDHTSMFRLYKAKEKTGDVRK